MFFEEIDGLSILERNSARLEGLELSQVRKLIKLYKEAKIALREQLLFSTSNTFTEAKLSVALEQITAGLKVLERRLNQELRFGFETLSEQGIEDSAKEINAFEKNFNGVANIVPINAILESTEPENFLFNQYQTSIDTYNQQLRGEFQRVLGQSLLQNKTWSQAVFDMEQVFDAQEWVLARIVRTELHQIYNAGKMRGFSTIQDDYFPDLKKTLYHPMDSRTGGDSMTAAAKNLIVDLDKPFVYTFIQGKKTITRTFQFPPDRPNDRAILIPYRESYDKRS
jgi:hypothetical protein